MTDDSFLSSNGKTPIRFRSWTPEGPIRAVVQIAHGIGEHIERYNAFASFLAERGILVVGNDHLGHGKSIQTDDDKGFFGEIAGWELVVGDMRKLFELTCGQFPGIPYFLLGHSMGSFLARTYLIRYRDGLTGALLSGTSQQKTQVLKAAIALCNAEIRLHGLHYRSQRVNDMAFGGYNRNFANRTPYDWLTRDEEIVDSYFEDPLSGFIVTVSLFRDMLSGMAFNQRPAHLDRMNKALPVLFFSGDMDPVGGEGKGVFRAYQSFLNAGMEDVTLRLYHDGRHEMLSETNREQVFRDVLDWISIKGRI